LIDLLLWLSNERKRTFVSGELSQIFGK